MARQALPIIGGLIGGPWGYLAGSILGGIVDPQRIKAPSVGDQPAQTSAEGVPCPLYAGTTGGMGNLIYCSEPDIEEGEYSSGKGGPQVQEPNRVYRTFAIRIGMSLFTGPGNRTSELQLVKIWEDEKLVYDASPESTILEESAEFAEGFNFYPGTETQLPDPAIEAIKGVGNVSSYRGRAYIVFVRKDVTDRRSVPSFRFEVSVGGVPFSPVTLVTNLPWYKGDPQSLTLGGADCGLSAVTRVRVSPDGTYAAGLIVGSGASDRFQISKFDQETETWSALPSPATMPVGIINDIAWHPSGDYLTVTCNDPDPTGSLVNYKRSGDTFTPIAGPDVPLAYGANTVKWDSAGLRLAVQLAYSGERIAIFDFIASTDSLILFEKTPSLGDDDNDFRRMDWMPGTGSRYLALGGATRLVVLAATESPLRVAAVLTGASSAFAQGVFWDASSGYLITMGDIGEKGRVYAFDGSVVGAETLTFDSNFADQPVGTPLDTSISWDRQTLAVGNDISNAPQIYDLSGSLPPAPAKLASPASGAGAESVSFAIAGITQIEAGSATLKSVVLAASRRAKMLDAAWSVDHLAADTVRGVVVASQGYTAQDFINSLRWVYQLDGADYDGQIHLPKRGGAATFAITDDDLVDEQDDGEQDEALRNFDDKRTAPIRRPLKVNLMFPNRTVGYQLTKATSPHYGDRGDAVSEATFEVPVVLDDEVEAPQLADKLEKISRADAEAEIIRIVHEGVGAQITTGDVGTLTENGLTRRVRVETYRDGSGTKRLLMRVDRPYTYSSVVTQQPVPPPPAPPPVLSGLTQFVVLNIPGIVDADDRLGIRIGVAGLAGTAWHGATVRLSSDGGTTFANLVSINTKARMGVLVDPLSAASEFYPDNTNVLRVQMNDDRELETITEAEWLSEGNGAAVMNADGTAELVQFRDADDEGANLWALTRLQRGRLATEASAHAAASKFVMLDGTVFAPLPSSLIGQVLTLQFVSNGTSAEGAPTFTFTWDPAHSQTEFPPANVLLSRDGDDISATVVPRHRFGTEDAPIASVNFGQNGYLYRWTATDGSNSVTTDTVSPTWTFDATGWASPITVTAAALNRYTGAGPSISEDIA